jgi:hypothetical protein
MIEKSSSGSANKVVRLHKARSREEVLRNGDCSREGPTRIAHTGVPTLNSICAGPMVSHASGSYWSWLFTFFMEGFALYGAMLHPDGIIPLYADRARAGVPGKEGTCQGGRGRLRPVVLVATGPGSESSADKKVLEIATAKAGLAGSKRIPSVGSDLQTGISSQETVARWSHPRRERETKRAVDALAELDARTLRAMGILDRSQIDWVVRYCHDC